MLLVAAPRALRFLRKEVYSHRTDAGASARLRQNMADFQALKLLKALDEGVASRSGTSFFPHLVSSLARTLEATCAYVSEITPETYEAHVLAYWCEGKVRDPFVYNLSGTPCECV